LPDARNYRFGRTARTFDPRIPHLSAILGARKAPAITPAPAAVDWTKGMPDDLGAMRNDVLGDCTCAAYYHARQVWTFDARKDAVTEPDLDVERLYVEACGYDPNVPGEGPGGSVQQVLTYLLEHGAPVGPRGHSRDKIAAFVEVDPRNHDDIKLTIDDCGVAYIGFGVPANVTYDNRVWDVDPSAQGTEGGHAVVLAGYDDKGAIAISWGRRYTMTWAFVDRYVDEAYAIADHGWMERTKKTPAGMTLRQLEALMQAIRE
jgi:hypothetical protein